MEEIYKFWEYKDLKDSSGLSENKLKTLLERVYQKGYHDARKEAINNATRKVSKEMEELFTEHRYF